MIKLSDIKKDNRFPPFITNHNIFKEDIEIKKIFPEIGLENFSEKVQIDNSNEVIDAARLLINFIHNQVSNRLESLTRYAEIKTTGVSTNKKTVKTFGENRKVKYKKCSTVLKKLKTILGKSFKTLVIVNVKTGKITLNIPENICDDEKKVLFKAGEGLFRVYQKVNELLRDGHFLSMPPIDQESTFKKFSSVNIPNTESKIVFSSTGIDGAWDIATMSQRGISSCQSWDQNNSCHLVGSIVDPCTAIMYLTSGSNFEGFGSKMMRRCIVRFLINEANEPCLILERMYPQYNKDIADMFISILKNKTKNTLRIYNCSADFRQGISKTYIPLTPIVSKLEETARPYRDSAIVFKPALNNRDSYIENLRAQFANIHNEYARRALDGFAATKLSDFKSKEDREMWRAIRNGDVLTTEVFVETSFLVEGAIQKALKEVNDIDTKLPIAVLKLFDSVFTDDVLDLIVKSAVERFVRYSKIKPSLNYQNILRKKISKILSEKTEKQRAKLITKVEKIKGTEKISLISEEVINLIKKVS